MGIIEINEEFIKEIYNTKANALKRSAQKRLKDKELVEDAFQETMLDICRKIGMKIEIHNLDAWLYTILKFNCFRIIRKKVKTEYVLLNEEIDGIDENFKIDDKLNFMFMIKKIKEEENRKFAVYKYIYGFNNTEIAKIFKRDPKTISRRLNKSLEILKKKYEKGVI